MKQPNKQDFIEALRLAEESLRESIGAIDYLNGRLEELEYYGEFVDELDAKSQEVMNDAHRMYHELPVWDTLESLAGSLHVIADQVEEDEEETK